MNGEVTFQLICKSAVHSGNAGRADCRTQETAVIGKPWIPMEHLFGPDHIPANTGSDSDTWEGLCMQLTSPASCKKCLKGHCAGRQHLGTL